MSASPPRFEIATSGDDLRRFVTAVLGHSRFRVVADDARVEPEERVVAILTHGEEDERRVVVAAGDEPEHVRGPHELTHAKGEADAAVAAYRDELARIRSQEEAASERIEHAHDAIKQAEHELTEAKHALRHLEHDRANARTRYWLAMDSIAAFGQREPE